MGKIIIGINHNENINALLQLICSEEPSLSGKTLSIEILEKLPDIKIIDGRGESSIGIEEIKSLQKQLIYYPYSLKKQYGIIIAAERLTTEAQNSFLKTLEESPETTEYYLLTDIEENLLSTVLSRCQKVYTQRETLPDSERGDSFTAVTELLQADLVRQFSLIEELLAKEKEDRSSISNFLASLEQYFQQKLEIALKEGSQQNINSFLKCCDKIIDIKIKISANTNKKLALENLVLYLNKI